MRDSTAQPNIPAAVEVAIELSAAAGLRYVSDAAPGISRVRKGKGFIYFSPEKRRISAADELQRIAALAIPPAYSDVWICTHRRGHLQATGRDARRRKQYRYHPEWRAIRDDAKFDRMKEFGAALPHLRRKLSHDLKREGMPREKVLALLVTLLDTTQARIGNVEYARDNQSFGLTTLRNKHVEFVREGARLHFPGKSGIEHDIVIDDRKLASIVRRCHELPGQQLFQYLEPDGTRRSVDSAQVNEYLREATGAEFTAKDFRTWSATVRALELLASQPLPAKPSERAHSKTIMQVVKQVAGELRNTPAVCRKSYINPLAFTAWRSGELHRLAKKHPSRESAEKFALRFLQSSTPQAKRRARARAR